MTMRLPGIDPSPPPGPGWRVLSMRQPWLWAVLHAGKRIENRRTRWSFCGPVLLHEAVGCKRDEYDDAVAFMREQWLISADDGDGLPVIPRFEDLPRRGGIVARCRIVGRFGLDGVDYAFTFPADATPGTRLVAPPTLDMRWHLRGEQYGYALEDVAPTPFVKMRGMLGLLHAPPDVLRAALGEA